MKKMMWLGLLLGCLLLAACGTEQTGEDKVTGEGGKAEMNSAIEQLEGNLYLYMVTNNTGDSVVFEFTSGQRFDYSLTNEAGEELYLFSSTASFIQAMSEETVEDGESLEYELEVPPLELESGTYTLKAWLTPAQGAVFEAEAEYTVE